MNVLVCLFILFIRSLCTYYPTELLCKYITGGDLMFQIQQLEEDRTRLVFTFILNLLSIERYSSVKY